MNFYSIIEKKRDGGALTQDEIDFFIREYIRGMIPDYQASALLMAVYFQGMSFQETLYLTKAMLDSGERVNFNGVPGSRVDKHSTGGVGDKISLILLPTAVSLGCQVPMISGRGLGHTGGTLDKLQSIPGFKIITSSEQIQRMTIESGGVFAGQGENLVPADKKLYALRDVTATIKSIPMIAASIISKKAAEGIDGLVLDVKTGDGAIFSEYEKSLELAAVMVGLGEALGIETTALITDMSQPLGLTAGNALEVREAEEILQTGQGCSDLIELTEALGAVMLKLSGLNPSLREGIKSVRNALHDGRAHKKYLEITKAQGGCGRPDVTDSVTIITASRQGYIDEIPARRVGEMLVEMGAGRKKIDDSIDYSAGIRFHKKRGDFVDEGEIIAELFSANPSKIPQKLDDLVKYSDIIPESRELIKMVVDSKGEYSWEEYVENSE